MKLLRIVMDVWLPDFKFGPGDCAKTLARTPWYWVHGDPEPEGDPRLGRALHDPPPKHAHRCPPLKNWAAPAMRRSQHMATSNPPPKVRRVIFFMVSIESTLNGGYRQTLRVSKTRLPSRRSLKRRRVFSRPVPGPLPGPRRRRTNRPRRRWGKGPASGRAVESGRGRNRYRAFPSSPGAPFPGPP